MDGTLIDSEPYTSKAVIQYLNNHHLALPNLDWDAYFGITWLTIAQDLQQHYPSLNTTYTANSLATLFNQIMHSSPPDFLPQAIATLEICDHQFATALVTSNHRSSIEILLKRLGTSPFQFCLSAEDYNRSKPDPECYLLAADKLQIAPENCLVFEDSLAGIMAAKAAGMKVIAIIYRNANPSRAKQLADHAIMHFGELDKSFFHQIKT